jgi:soluble lytic murein transglycosylase-like protein
LGLAFSSRFGDNSQAVMRLSKPIAVAALLLAAQLSASAAEVAVLRNGFSIRFERKEQSGTTTRLYTRSGYMDIPTAEIASFEPDDSLPEPPPTATQPAPASMQPASLQPVSAYPSATQPVATQQAAIQPARTVAATPPTKVDLDQVVREASKRHQIDPDFVNSVIKAESNFYPRAVSKKGAQGLMQLMPATASKLGVSDPFDPKANVEAGTAHLSALLDMYNNDPIKALAAYNAGAHRVKQYNGVPPYAETRAYVAKIVRDFNAKKRAKMKAVTAQANTTKPATKSKPSKPQQASVAKPTGPA